MCLSAFITFQTKPPTEPSRLLVPQANPVPTGQQAGRVTTTNEQKLTVRTNKPRLPGHSDNFWGPQDLYRGREEQVGVTYPGNKHQPQISTVPIPVGLKGAKTPCPGYSTCSLAW